MVTVTLGAMPTRIPSSRSAPYRRPAPRPRPAPPKPKKTETKRATTKPATQPAKKKAA